MWCAGNGGGDGSGGSTTINLMNPTQKPYW